MSDDTRRVLELLAQGKITVDDADQLLRALSEPARAEAAPPPDAGDPAKPRYLRINVHKIGKEGRADKDVNIRVPLSILRSGMRLGTLIPGLNDNVSNHLRARGIDLTNIDHASIETLLKDFGELKIDVNEGHEQVRITCE